MAIYGWETLKQAELYTKAANRIRLAKDATTFEKRVVPRDGVRVRNTINDLGKVRRPIRLQ
jgi:hypothetical protein